MLGVPPVRFLLPHHRGPDLGRIPQPQLHAQLRQQALEPGIMPAGFHPHPNRLSGQRTVKLFGLSPVAQPFFFICSRLIVKDRDLLKPRMKITAYNQHDVGSFSESLGFFAATIVLAAIEPTSLCNQAEPLFRRSEGSPAQTDPAYAEQSGCPTSRFLCEKWESVAAGPRVETGWNSAFCRSGFPGSSLPRGWEFLSRLLKETSFPKGLTLLLRM
jgi:hypothetical protein